MFKLSQCNSFKDAVSNTILWTNNGPSSLALLGEHRTFEVSIVSIWDKFDHFIKTPHYIHTYWWTNSIIAGWWCWLEMKRLHFIQYYWSIFCDGIHCVIFIICYTLPCFTSVPVTCCFQSYSCPHYVHFRWSTLQIISHINVVLLFLMKWLMNNWY